ncbi:hypothetical protein V6N13_005476 [Hibiscus sabdariffa]|uniref:TF-B3 domain-containing protein n=1 Tax=Hibiscus sabdariffa TaxID=183260 RepID=A0ABR2EQK2_9ROSI
MALFFKVLTKMDVERTLSLPDGCLKALPESQVSHGRELQVMDDVGMLWNFRCVIRAGVVPKLNIVSGWTQFVRIKQLCSGDSVLLYRDDDTLTGARYKIEVSRSHEN